MEYVIFYILGFVLFMSALGVYLTLKDVFEMSRRRKYWEKSAKEDEEMHKRIDIRLYWKFNHKTPILSYGDLTQPWDGQNA